MSTPEGKVKDYVKRRMLAKYPNCYRFMPVQNGMGAPSLDMIYCVDGLFVAIETKKPKGKPTPRQETTMKQITDAGGMAFVVDGPDSMDLCIAGIDKTLWGRANAT